MLLQPSYRATNYNAVLDDGAKNIKDIIRLTGAMKNGKCEINNPLGKCCSPFIQETINKALKANKSLWNIIYKVRHNSNKIKNNKNYRINI